MQPGVINGSSPGSQRCHQPSHHGGNYWANRCFLESTPIQMPPESGGIWGRLTYDLLLGCHQPSQRDQMPHSVCLICTELKSESDFTTADLYQNIEGRWTVWSFREGWCCFYQAFHTAGYAGEKLQIQAISGYLICRTPPYVPTDRLP